LFGRIISKIDNKIVTFDVIKLLPNLNNKEVLLSGYMKCVNVYI